MTNSLVVSPTDRAETAGRAAFALEEAENLAHALELHLVPGEAVRLGKPNPATYLGPGKVADIAARVASEDVGLVIVNTQLSPVQQRNLEREWKAKVLDRTGLILEIFGERARTREGVLQVDLAHLSYQKSRLVRSWTHLERQRGGAGFMGGPGERQIEADRRQIDERITRLRRQLDKVVKTRNLHRAARRKVPHPVVALVGYTNAGKSTLFNSMTEAGVLAKDMLFATLDPTMRQITLPSGRTAILSDTVGFISNLPTELVAAFRATLEEVLEADLILHVRDIASPWTEDQRADVDRVLSELGLDENAVASIAEVWNKTDLLEPAERETLLTRVERDSNAVAVSAATGAGIATLLQAIEDRLFPKLTEVVLQLGHSDGRAVAWLYDHGEVRARENTDAGPRLRVALTEREYFQFQKAFPSAGKPGSPPLAAQ